MRMYERMYLHVCAKLLVVALLSVALCAQQWLSKKIERGNVYEDRQERCKENERAWVFAVEWGCQCRFCDVVHFACVDIFA